MLCMSLSRGVIPVWPAGMKCMVHAVQRRDVIARRGMRQPRPPRPEYKGGRYANIRAMGNMVKARV